MAYVVEIVVDRDSVAAGDDGYGHAGVWTMPPGTRLGEVVVQLVERRFLFAMPNACWVLSLLTAPEVYRDGAGEIAALGGDGEDIGVLAAEPGRDGAPDRWRYVHLSGRYGPRTELGRVPAGLPDGRRALRARYVTSEWSDFEGFTTFVEETDEARDARIEAVWAAARAEAEQNRRRDA